MLTPQIFLPHLSLAFEYQGEQHYYSVNHFGHSSVRQRRDQAKIKFANLYGISLISIPFWWDRSSNSLAATIRNYRPDINLDSITKEPIPLEMPLKYQKRSRIRNMEDKT
jgi:hypothetical protein